MINKKGNIYAVVGVLGTVLLVISIVIALMLGGSTLNEVTGEIFTEVRGIGAVTENVNVTEYADIVFAPVENILGNYGLFAGVLYVLGIVLVFTLAFVFRNNLNGWSIALFVVAALLIITFAIILSNTYEVFYDGDDFIGEALREETMTSWLILYSPTIMTIVIFLAGIIMMTGKGGGYP